MPRQDIHCRFFSQEDLLAAGCLDIGMAMQERALEAGLRQDLQIQNEMMFEHAKLKDWVRF